MRFRFRISVNAEEGFVGMALEAFTGFDPRLGDVVAHNVLEHYPDGDASVEDELRAFGAMLFVRLEGGMWTSTEISNGMPFRAIASLILEPLLIMEKESRQLSFPAAADVWVPEHIDCAIKAILDEAMGLLRASRRSGNPSALEQGELTLQSLRAVSLWMKLGYVQATERFSGETAADVLRVFRQIQAVADDALTTLGPSGINDVFEVLLTKAPLAASMRVLHNESAAAA